MAAPGDSPATIVLAIGGPIAPADVPDLCKRVRVVLESSDAELVVCDVGALTDPDAVAVDALARMQLTARRLGHQLRLRHASGELKQLLAFTGLRGVVLVSDASRLRPWWQAEKREQVRGVEECVEPHDPPG